MLTETRNILVLVLSTEKVIQQCDFSVIIYLHRKGIVIIFPQMITLILVPHNIPLTKFSTTYTLRCPTMSIKISSRKKTKHRRRDRFYSLNLMVLKLSLL